MFWDRVMPGESKSNLNQSYEYEKLFCVILPMYVPCGTFCTIGNSPYRDTAVMYTQGNSSTHALKACNSFVWWSGHNHTRAHSQWMAFSLCCAQNKTEKEQCARVVCTQQTDRPLAQLAGIVGYHRYHTHFGYYWLEFYWRHPRKKSTLVHRFTWTTTINNYSNNCMKAIMTDKSKKL